VVINRDTYVVVLYSKNILVDTKFSKFSKIVVGVDGSKESIEAANYAIGLAKKDNAQLIVLTVLKLPSFYGWSAIEAPKEWQEKDRLETQQWFDKISQMAKENNVEVRTQMIETPASIEAAIVHFAEEQKADLIVVGTRGRTGFSKQLLGSVASGIVTYAHCPVMVVK
jgi:nucleotide-binding universal stress UspA family protein